MRLRESSLAGCEESFVVHLQRSGRTIVVPAEKTVLQALREAGVVVNSMCCTGLCGTCQTRVIDGDVDHRDTFLTDTERELGQYMMVCVSRAYATGGLVLDL
ncbi:2Fe-2S iron-sulfur cluster binding domain-containing protein [Mycobacterium sp. CBMA293]|uniref:2Fe-2S iron-sulfur cluster-binding protein n=1 Tax=unclassified Mycolicibacterium TaxID=2636767 RepID=UPI0012DBF5B8|nr:MULTISPECIES: 2Fe-2S iron-sulfur cluster binding domain-containing protein [unclassified Mycolicibacterium]MUL47307.1 2Fe-2S iron-sulfur cluster binding domain-containing protein [Mycolicibacterium sp. CBMA 360]MUL61418.1 2Fe-2S iron-sulfur cluster binding domain-containing protein [Mycolicibacterium sp. CBMA 335]MUL72153.1 2Fe-2S iron-sulfur cluster binding domain-containing protein [Mycolicibacterium sp. CBMA 311]MUL96320.1 2Fe-2S iron-sulfur cluster binding domain-containing protein [Myco